MLSNRSDCFICIANSFKWNWCWRSTKKICSAVLLLEVPSKKRYFQGSIENFNSRKDFWLYWHHRWNSTKPDVLFIRLDASADSEMEWNDIEPSRSEAKAESKREEELRTQKWRTLVNKHISWSTRLRCILFQIREILFPLKGSVGVQLNFTLIINSKIGSLTCGGLYMWLVRKHCGKTISCGGAWSTTVWHVLVFVNLLISVQFDVWQLSLVRKRSSRPLCDVEKMDGAALLTLHDPTPRQREKPLGQPVRMYDKVAHCLCDNSGLSGGCSGTSRIMCFRAMV